MQARAAVFDGTGKPFRLERFAIPVPVDGEAVVRVECCTICGSDLHTHGGRRTVAGPTVLGHELIGHVEQLGERPPRDFQGEPLRIGDRVTWTIAASCGVCFFCRHELPQKCEHLLKYGHASVADGRPLSGGLATHCHVAAGTTLIKLPTELPAEVACPANCATATVAAALRAAGDVAERAVVVHGAGLLGLTAAAMARFQRAEHVIVTDVDTQRAERSLQFGATAAFSVDQQESLSRHLREVTQHRGADVALEMSGASAAFATALEQLRIGGRLVLVGAVFPTPAVDVLPERIVRRSLQITGVHNYAPEDLAAAIDFLLTASSDYPFAELVSQPFPLAEVEAAFALAATAQWPRVLVRP